MQLAYRCEEPDRVPILFRATVPLNDRWNSQIERAEVLLEMGADAMLSVGAPAPQHSDVTTRLWREPCEPYPVLHKEYETPAGVLHASVQVTADWQVDDIPLYSDHAWSRGLDYLVKTADDLDALDYILGDPMQADLTAFREQCDGLHQAAERLGVALQGTIHPTPVCAMGLLGGHRAIMAVRDEPELWRELLARVKRWSQQGLALLLELGVDAIYRSSCYETVDLFAPRDVREFFMPILREDTELCHQAGIPMHSFAQTGVMPFLDDYAQIGIDILSSLDARGTNPMDLAETKRRLGGVCCLMGGVDNRDPFIMHPASQMEETVLEVLRVMAPGGGYILSTAGMIFAEGNVENIEAFIAAGRKYGRYPLDLPG